MLNKVQKGEMQRKYQISYLLKRLAGGANIYKLEIKLIFKFKALLSIYVYVLNPISIAFRMLRKNHIIIIIIFIIVFLKNTILNLHTYRLRDIC